MLGRILGAALALTSGLGLAQAAAAADLRPDQLRFREIYKELVETNTSLSVGSCTVAAAKMGARLKSAGFTDADLTYFSVPDHPKEGGVVAILKGSSKTAKPMLLLGHLDVVEAKRADWTRDPFVFIEENGVYYGRGVADMKVIDATWVDTLMRFKETRYVPKRTIKLALTCGEETLAAFNGADYLARNKRDLIDAEFALNEGGGGRADKDGKLQSQGVQVGEKVVQQFRMETTNAGGHSSVPIRDNAIYQLAQGLLKVRDYEFPVTMNDTTRAFFAKAGAPTPQAWPWSRSRRTPPTRPPKPSSTRTAASTPCCAPPASPPCWTAAMPRTPCPSGPAPTSTAGCSQAPPWRTPRPGSRPPSATRA
jgi:acetylornithine deacetylase/succinyl-diaminopimelate desuccinylase-like protein